MHPLSSLPFIFFIAAAGSYFWGRSLAIRAAISAPPVSNGRSRLHSVPGYHGVLTMLWTLLPAVVLWLLFIAVANPLLLKLAMIGAPNVASEGLRSLFQTEVLNLSQGFSTAQAPSSEVLAVTSRFLRVRTIAEWGLVALCIGLMVAGFVHGGRLITPGLRARNQVEMMVTVFLALCSLVAIITTLGIVLSLAFEAWRFFERIPVLDFLTGLQWSPQTAIRTDQVGNRGAFGAVPLFVGTLLITFVSLLIAAPIGLMAAIYMSEYAQPRVRAIVKPVLEILAGIPTVVYGFFAVLTVAPVMRVVGRAFGLSVSSESALAAGVVMGVMIVPFISSLSDDVINAVPQSLRDGSYGLGATRSETIRLVVLPAALPGIVAAIMLAVSRAIGETMIVTMAAGLAAQGAFWDNFNPLNAVTTVTTQIATLLVGDQEFDSPKTLSAFGLGLVLFLVTLSLNAIALWVVQKYQEKYD
ncbi:phosphate transport system permease protein [Azospirillaceae bacterium]